MARIVFFIFTLSISFSTYAGNEFFRYTGGICINDNCSAAWAKINVSPYENADILHLLNPNTPWPNQVTTNGSTYELKDGKIWKLNSFVPSPCPINGCQSGEVIDNNPRTIKIVADNGQLFQLHNNGMIWRYLGSPGNWEPVDNNSRSKDIVIGGGNLFQKHNNGQIWKFRWVPCSGNLNSLNCSAGWEMIDKNSRTLKIGVKDGTLYQVHNW